ncbi:hypothetical protein GUITHDRAFT_148626 [Guillardia theta CCMP2712]|uniref:Uncharacterized protein n=1 Tax=Guillardia theta (strain CCMP2712) TaxID=905079 RepID=L1I862_GUITC|nr:hypothetical protein GUITHDRAFT_148626 [Guillardia theta CCMP2712]EKX32451.1 hypothetical protein GUITHDRAFT_148626 [Guillardia theta CCMP2712]|eukprot:XP_005819431.1 hypothetical protein GUITHDRAFT_148626 [Guillardia theta CCMP2712]
MAFEICKGCKGILPVFSCLCISSFFAYSHSNCETQSGRALVEAQARQPQARSLFVSKISCNNRWEREDLSPDRRVQLGTTQTSWQGWGSSNDKKQTIKIEVDKSNPEAGVKEALLKARESEAIAKYLGTTESKQRAGITGDVEFVKMTGSELTLRLTGNFWHNRQMVFDDVAKFIKDALPAGVVQDVVIEDPQQLQGFAETSNDRERLTEEDLRKREAKGKNIYGEKLEGPAAQFKRKKAENQAKYEEEVKKQRELEGKGDAAQIKAIIEEKGLSDFFSGKGGQAMLDGKM